MNRVTSRTYSDGTTPTVTYLYDTLGAALNGKGRLTSVSSSVSTYSYGGYDAIGRVTSSTQATSGSSYSMSYQYNLAGGMTSETYPSGKQITTDYDSAGRIAGVKNQATGSYYAGATATDSLNRMQYTAHGAMTVMKRGDTKWEHTNFNSRLQPTQIGLGTASTDSGMLELDYGFGSTSNNGNVLSQRIIAGTGGMDVTQNYTYDALNRLLSATEIRTSDSVQQWKQTFTYDRYGNRNFDVANTTPSSVMGANPTINQTNNRISTGQSYGYDDAGNLTSDPTTDFNGIVCDAENRQTSYTKSGQSANTYFYDGDGRRVKRVVGTTTTVFVYNAMGQLIAEYDNINAQPLTRTQYVTADHLGSTRLVTKDGIVKTRLDYLPFGEELAAGLGLRTSGMGYSVTDSTRKKFTSKERDGESGLDYFLARYYSSAQGRFTSADAPLVGQSEEDPQSWNLYGYTRNNPLVGIDPTGRKTCYFLDGKRIGCEEDGNVTHDYEHETITVKGKTYNLADLEVKTIVKGRYSVWASIAAGGINGITFVHDAFARAVLGEDIHNARITRQAQSDHPLAGGIAEFTTSTIVAGFTGRSAARAVELIELFGSTAGRRALLGEVAAASAQGSSSRIRLVSGSAQDAEALFKQIASPGTIRAHPKIPGGLIAEGPGGGTIGYRPYSTSGPPTIDLNRVPGFESIKEIKFR